MDNSDGLILLTQFRFPQHVQVAEWLNETEYGEQYYLVIAQVAVENYRGTKSTFTCSALEHKIPEKQFLWKLKGPEALAEIAAELEQKILDFHKK